MRLVGMLRRRGEGRAFGCTVHCTQMQLALHGKKSPRAGRGPVGTGPEIAGEQYEARGAAGRGAPGVGSNRFV